MGWSAIAPRRACSDRCPGVFGSLQALEALKILLDLPGQLGDELLVVDLFTLRSARCARSAPQRVPQGRCARIRHIRSPPME